MPRADWPARRTRPDPIISPERDAWQSHGPRTSPWGVLGLEPHPLAGDINDAIGAVPGIERGTATLLVPRKWRTKPRTEANAGGEFD